MTETELHLIKTQAKCNVTTVNYLMIDGEHICILKVSISKNRMKKNDEDLSELELKSFWYKLRGLYCPPQIPAGFLRIPEDSCTIPGLSIG